MPSWELIHLEKYLSDEEPIKRERAANWRTAIGLQAVDGLKTSSYLVEHTIRNIEGELSFKEVEELLKVYHDKKNKEKESDELHN